MMQRAKATINGVVQGVGFRPFIYNLAKKNLLKGYIANTSKGIDVEVEGEPEEIHTFFSEIQANKPPLAKITHIDIRYLPLRCYTGFVIEDSKVEAYRSTLIPPDVAICKDCLREMSDAGDRRFRYPFINCTNCGPRFTIIKDIPYDRDKTTMASFAMCEACRKEYEEPTNRRFHAQPIACWQCGPHVCLYWPFGRPLDAEDPIRAAGDLLRSGKIVAIKGLGGFHLAADATNDAAVQRLRERKQREEKPLAIMSLDIETIGQYAQVSSLESRLLESQERPIVLLQKKKQHVISSQIAPQNSRFGVMLPYTPLHYLILQEGFIALVMTSGNISEEPIAVDNQEAFRRLSGIADYFLVHDRGIRVSNDDSVVHVINEKARVIRRSRGYAPVPIFLPRSIRPTLGCGPFLSNTVCLGNDRNAFISQHVGDLENLEALEAFEKIIHHLKTILEIQPMVIAYDLHPDYQSTQYALKQEKLRQIGVQHHHAHIAACMAENGVDGPVIGLAMDGSGYGIDGTIWGGEILLADYNFFERVGHLQTISLPGGEAAIREPWRMGLAYLYNAFGKDLLELPLEFVRRLDRGRARIIITMIEKSINSPLATSCGRLFDGIAAMVGLRSRVSYRGQAAIDLEMEMDDDEGCYLVRIDEDGGRLIISHTPIVQGVVSDLMEGVDRKTISRKFHNTLVSAFTSVCIQLGHRLGLKRVALSGGVFQNAFLLGELERSLLNLGFEVYSHSLVPTNDGGISLGQVMVANAVLDA